MKNTKLIIDFMGWETWKPLIAKIKMFNHTMVTTPFGAVELSDLKRNLKTDWNWLKLVVDYIGEVPEDVPEGISEYMEENWKLTIFSKRDAVYKAVIQYIKWYNENKNDKL